MAVKGDFSSKDSRVQIFETDKEAFYTTAAKITELIAAGLTKNSVSNVIIAAGNSISQTLEFLRHEDADWRNVNWFLADERCVAHGDPRRNDLQIIKILKSSLGENHGRVFSTDALLSPKEAAIQYASRIGQIDMFDFCLLGMGNDGHVASLLPNHAALESDQICCKISDSPNPPAERITLTFNVFCQIKNRILITTGPGKTNATTDYINNLSSPVRRYDPTKIFADKAAYA